MAKIKGNTLMSTLHLSVAFHSASMKSEAESCLRKTCKTCVKVMNKHLLSQYIKFMFEHHYFKVKLSIKQLFNEQDVNRFKHVRTP